MKKLFLTAAVLLTVFFQTQARIVIVPPPRPIPMPVPYPHHLSIKDYDVRVKITGQLATTTVEQVYQNSFPRMLEGIYLFPVPEGASISKFYLYVNGEEVPGEVLEANEARRIYEGIVRQMNDPALLEFAGCGLFRARIFPIPANGEAKIKLSYSQVLKPFAGLFEYKYNFGREEMVPTGVNNISLQMQLNSNVPLKNIYSPSHEVRIDRSGEKSAKIDWVDNAREVGGDFVLYYAVSPKDIAFSLLTDRQDGENYFMALISPEVKPSATKTLTKDILFILDSSGSMRGDKMKQAKEALLFCLHSLNPGDRFNIVDFDDQVRLFAEGTKPATSGNLREAEQFVELIEAEGGTNIAGALEAGLSQLASGRLNYAIFLTDGLPTVGITNVDEILTMAKRANDTKVKIFDFGVGFDVNTHLLDKLAEQNSGASDYVVPTENIEVKVSNFYKKISAPVLANLKLDFGSVRTFAAYPNDLPDLFAGSQLVVVGKFNGSGKTSVTLTGELNGERTVFEFPADFSVQNGWEKSIPKIWATRRVGHLIDQVRLSGQSQEVVDEIITLSKKYGIINQYTSFLVKVDPATPLAQAAEQFRREAADMSAPAGRQAVAASKMANEAKGALTLNGGFDAQYGNNASGVRALTNAGGKTFFRQNERWVEADRDDKKPVVKIKPFSPAYFAMLKVKPEFGKYVALGKQVSFDAGKVTVEIAEDGKEKLTEEELNRYFR
ncbi:MAG: VWA domain-containing protein [candidate division Zixibacteria bacterium]|nr:VWA domain-containing protein [candidate division Zixibacteria bacterium]